jgi:hypothetical protein
MFTSLDEIDTILEKAPVLPEHEVRAAARPQRAVAVAPSDLMLGDLGIWRDSSAVRAAQTDLLEGVEMNPASVTLAQIALRDGVQPAALEAALGALYDRAEVTCGRPDRLPKLRQQLPDLVRRITQEMGTTAPHLPAAEDFPMVDASDPCPLDTMERMFRDSVWVRDLTLVYDIPSGMLQNRAQFNPDNTDVSPANHKTASPWAIFTDAHATDMEQPGRRQVADKITYMPCKVGQPLLTTDRSGRVCVNTFTPSLLKPAAGAVSDLQVKPWLDLNRWLYAEATDHLLDWEAFLYQHPGEKINHAPMLMGGKGIGKGVSLMPLIAILGEQNCVEIGANAVGSDFNEWVDRKQLILVDEMHIAGKRETMQTLKGYITAPPATVRINKKGIGAYHLPNVLAMIFMSNLAVPVSLEKGDRRFFVINSKVEKRDRAYYDAIVDFYDAGGYALIASWLLARDVTAFNAKGEAPMTADKEEVRKGGRTAWEEFFEDGITDQTAPFEDDILCVEEVVASLPRALGNQPRPSAYRARLLLLDCGAVAMHDNTQQRLGFTLHNAGVDRGRLMACRRQATYLKVLEDDGLDKIKALFRLKQNDHRPRDFQTEVDGGPGLAEVV